MIITNHQPWAVALNGQRYDRNQKGTAFWNGPITLTNEINVGEVLRQNLRGMWARKTEEGNWMIESISNSRKESLDSFLDNMVKAESISPTSSCLVIDHNRRVRAERGLFEFEILEFRFMVPSDQTKARAFCSDDFVGVELFKLREAFKDEFAKLIAE